MTDHALEKQKLRLDEVKQRAKGRWDEVLIKLGVNPKLLNRRNQPCPHCGGRDRFQYDDRFGDGNFYCRTCGHGDGLQLLEYCRGIGFSEALQEVEAQLGLLTSAPASRSTGSADTMKHLLNRVWVESEIIKQGDVASRYLAGRGLVFNDAPRALRLHPDLDYFEKDGNKSVRVGSYPAIVAKVKDWAGRPVTLHRTYLDRAHATKAAVESPKKLMSAGISGAAVHLFDASSELAVTEGIETGLAVHLLTGLPVWAALTAGNLEKLVLPEVVRKVHIFADNDPHFQGQASAYLLANRLVQREKRSVEVQIPKEVGDWLDVLQMRKRKAA